MVQVHSMLPGPAAVYELPVDESPALLWLHVSVPTANSDHQLQQAKPCPCRALDKVELYMTSLNSWKLQR